MSVEENLVTKKVKKQYKEGVPTDVTSFKFFMWVIVPLIVFIVGFGVLYGLDKHNGVDPFR